VTSLWRGQAEVMGYAVALASNFHRSALACYLELEKCTGMFSRCCFTRLCTTITSRSMKFIASLLLREWINQLCIMSLYFPECCTFVFVPFQKNTFVFVQNIALFCECCSLLCIFVLILFLDYKY